MSVIRYRISYKKSVDKDLRKLSSSVRKQIVIKIQSLAVDPKPSGVTKLRDSTNLFRVRHSDYRIIYQIKDKELVILIVKVGHRREVYRDI